MKNSLGDRMKEYENRESGRRLIPLLPVVARMDGRSFHAFTRRMKRPFDETFSDVMVGTTEDLLKETNACTGYTQSDEITLVWHSTNYNSQIWFDGRIAKMTSQLAAFTTLMFYRRALESMSECVHLLPTFDARVWDVPNRIEAVNALLWREQDATKNSVSMAASRYYSHNELLGKNTSQKIYMLHDKDINWNDYPAAFKYGVYVRRRRVVKPFAAEEIDKLPLKHQARANPALSVERWEWDVSGLPPLRTIMNREDVVFEGAEPQLAKEVDEI